MRINNDLYEIDVLNELSERIKQYRISADMTQKVLAKKTGISIKTISRFENGGDIGILNLVKILKALDLGNNVDLLVPDHRERPTFYVDGREFRKKARYKEKKVIKKGEWKWGDEK